MSEQKLMKRLECMNCGATLDIPLEQDEYNLRACCANSKRKLISAEGVAGKELIERENDRIVLRNKFSPVAYAERLRADYFFILDKYKRFWRYDGVQGIWKEDTEEFLREKIRARLLPRETQFKFHVNEIITHVRDLSYKPDFEGLLDENIIPFQNCLLDLETGNFIDFDSKYFVTNKIPVAIDSNYADCDIIDSFFEDCVGKEYKVMLYELIGYCLYRGMPIQKLFMLFGSGLNGKSVFLELLRAFLGTDNVSSVSPHDLCNKNNRFSLSGIWNKYANISSDISYDTLENVSKLKELTGGDTIYVERKFKDSFPAKSYAKQIFSTNQLPLVKDKTFAWYRRIYLIEFPNQPKYPDAELLKKLTSKKQLRGLAWKAVKSLKKMKERGFKLSYEPDIDKLAETYEKLSNPLIQFLSEHTQEDGEGSIFKYEFRDYFITWLKENKLRVWNDTEIGRKMKELGYQDGRKLAKDLSSSEGKLVSKQYKAWLGLRLQRNSQGSQGSHPLTNSFLYTPLIEPSYNPLTTMTTMTTEPEKETSSTTSTRSTSSTNNNPNPTYTTNTTNTTNIIEQEQDKVSKVSNEIEYPDTEQYSEVIQ